MKPKNHHLWLFASLILMLALMTVPALAQEPLPPPTEEPLLEPAPAGAAGTILTAEKDAEGSWKQTIKYDWTVDKSVKPSSMTIPLGETGSLEYTIQVVRNKASETNRFIVHGEICVTNTGDVATEDLKLVDQVQYKVGDGEFQDLAGASETITPPSQLAPGEHDCYKYNFAFTPVEGAVYRNIAKITITNHTGHLGEEFGPVASAGFSLPGAPTDVQEIDKEAELSDVVTCPDGFTCTPSDAGPWNFTGSGEIKFTLLVKNVSAPCDYYSDLKNVATLMEISGGSLLNKDVRKDEVTVEIYHGECQRGCTLTIGYWKTHAGFTGNNADRVSQYLPIWLGTPGVGKSVQVTSAGQAVTILKMSGEASNGVNKLYAQLLGARLNIANGASGSSISSSITLADIWLSMWNASDWSSLTKAQKQWVNALASTFDDYNNGELGPGHCP